MLPEEAIEALLVIFFLAMVFSIVALVILLKRSLRRPSTRTSLIHERNNVKVAPEGLTGDNLIVRTLPAAYRPRERAHHGVHPRPSGWRPSIMRSRPPVPFETYPDLERGLTSHGNGGLSRATAWPPAVPGGHHGCTLAETAGDGDHFIQREDGSEGPRAPPYWTYELYEVPSYEAAATSDREGARSVRILGGVETGRRRVDE